MKYFSLFSGIGGFELGIEKAYENSDWRHTEKRSENDRNQSSVDGGDGERGRTRPDCVGYSKQIYKKVHGNNSFRHKTNAKRGEAKEIFKRNNTNTQRNNVERALPSCVGFSEIDKYATQIYQKHFPNHKAYGDITKINAKNLPDFELLVGGFPCQTFSIAGKRGGFNDTRGTMFFEIARIVGEKQPRLLLLENVKGLLSHDQGRTFATIIRTLDELGYDLQWQVLNSKNHGVPQNRERVYIIGHLRGTPRPEVFPFGGTDRKDTPKVINPLKEKTQYGWHFEQGVYSKNGVSRSLKANGGSGNLAKIIQMNNPTHSNERVYDQKGISPTINTAQGGNRQPFVAMQWRRTEKGKEARRKNQKKGKDYTPFSSGHRELIPKENKPVGALTAQAIAKDSLLGTKDKTKIRRLTPTECERLQGFPDGWTAGESDTQRYKTLGNAVTVNVVEDIMSAIL